ncbi:MAG: T9SS type A sorting domain-containing protein [Bacteroidales bacterium]|nr:T9SS type A sorting domain-containing protein [Bacteroidales bacterium]
MKTISLTILILAGALFSSAQFPRDQKIIAAEYFIGNDPGEGNGTQIDTGTPLVDKTISLTNVNLPIGQTIFLRFKSSNGTWSAPRGIKRQEYFTNSDAILVYGEYFINNDPGVGHGNEINFQSGIVNLNGLNLQRGDKIYFRIQDSFNRWSPARPVQFNFKHIDHAEYKLKYISGNYSDSLEMNLSPFNPSSCIYTANLNNVDTSNTGYVYVRYQSFDKFLSPWAIDSLNVGIDEKFDNPYKFSCYPNPCVNVANLTFELSAPSNICININSLSGFIIRINKYGKLIKGKHVFQIDVSDIPNGVYYCQLETDYGNKTIKLIVQK